MTINEVLPQDEVAITAFIDVANPLYSVQQKVQDKRLIRSILQRQHALAVDVYIEAYYIEHRARGILFRYPGEDTIYLGFLEGREPTSLQTILQHLCQRALALGGTSVVGPVDLSFWLGYRMRVADALAEAFTGEPWHQDFYAQAFASEDFQVAETYVSNHYSREAIQASAAGEKSQQRYELALAKGYTFRTLEPDNWDDVLGEVYELLMETYSDFPMFREISWHNFVGIFSPLRQIIDFSMVEMVYAGDTLAGFLLTLPDYGTRPYRPLTPLNIWHIMRRKRLATHYVLLYMAVRPGHYGLGLAMTYRQFAKIKARRASATAALIHQGKFTQHYEADLITSTTTYHLYRKDLH